MVDVLSCACADTSTSQLSALLNLHKSVLDLQKRRPSRMLKEVEDSCNKLSKPSTITPNHLDILAELPSNLNILLLQHSKDGSELYGAFYERDPNQIEKTAKETGALACSRVAKVSVCLQALQALRDECLAFSHKERQTLHKKGGQPRDEEYQKSSIEETSETNFKIVVQHMEEYLNPLLSQFDFGFSRPQEDPLESPELTKPTDKERKSPEKEPEQYVIVLADMMLMDLPLEALSILQDDGLCCVSRDFSLQLLHRRLGCQPEKGASESRKETKEEKRTKGKKNQSQVIKDKPEQALLSNTIPVDMQNFRYIVDPNNKAVFEETSLSLWMQQLLEKHNQLTPPWKGFLGSQQKPSRSEVEQLLCTCSGFLYLGMERFGTNIPPAKLAALNMSECRVALLFDSKQNASRILCQPAFDKETSGSRGVMEKPSEMALLLSSCGVGCVVLQQWPSTLQETAQTVDSVLDYLLRVRQTCGQAVHVLRAGTPSPRHRVTQDPELSTDSKEGDGLPNAALKPSAFNCVLYGLPNLVVYC